LEPTCVKSLFCRDGVGAHGGGGGIRPCG
jgi:hypothetical protein